MTSKLTCKTKLITCIVVAHPLFGFFGTRKGQMMPTMPQKTLKMMIGMAEAPIAQFGGSEVENSEDEDETAAVTC